MARNPARSSAVSLLAVCLSFVVVSARAQSLAAAAKKEQERRSKPTAGDATKTYTDQDLPGYSVIAPAEAAATPDATKRAAGPPKGTRSADPTLESRGREQLIWRQRADSLRAYIQQAEARVRELDTTRVGGAQIQSCGVANSSSGEARIRCSEWESLYSRAKRNLDSAKRALVDLEESARRQGVPAGWLR